jgi:hypothetical protein
MVSEITNPRPNHGSRNLLITRGKRLKERVKRTQWSVLSFGIVTTSERHAESVAKIREWRIAQTVANALRKYNRLRDLKTPGQALENQCWLYLRCLRLTRKGHLLRGLDKLLP